MRKDMLLPGLALAGGALGLGLRQWHLSAAYDPVSQLFAAGHPAAYALPALIGALALVFILLLRGIPKPTSGAHAFRCPASSFLTLMSASGLLFLAAGVLGLMEGMERLSLWRVDPSSQVFTYPAALILCALLSLCAGPATLLLGKVVCRGTDAPSLPLLVNVPAIAALVWLFATHMAHSTDPILLGYVFSLAAAALLLLAHYYIAAFFHGRPHPLRCALSALLGVTRALISLADRPSLFGFVLTAALALSALACCWALLRNTFGPPWPARLLETRMPLGAQDDDGDDDDDEEDLFP